MLKTPLTYAAGIILLTLFVRCQSHPRPLSQKEFSKIYQDSISRRIPGAKFTPVDDRSFNTTIDSNTVQFSTDNAYKEYTDRPDSLAPILRQYIASAVEAALQPNASATKENVVPLIKPLLFLDQMQLSAFQGGTKEPLHLVYERYNNELIVCYAYNSGASFAYFDSADLKKLKIPHDSLRSIALRNLADAFPEVKRLGGNGLYMLTAGGNFEASLILMNDIWDKKKMPVKGDYIISVPARDMLLVTGSNDKPNLDKLRSMTKETYEKGDHVISDKLYRWNGKNFVVFE